jgi:hypothetical protein
VNCRESFEELYMNWSLGDPPLKFHEFETNCSENIIEGEWWHSGWVSMSIWSLRLGSEKPISLVRTLWYHKSYPSDCSLSMLNSSRVSHTTASTNSTNQKNSYPPIINLERKRKVKADGVERWAASQMIPGLVEISIAAAKVVAEANWEQWS